jgi:hypothetical protein
MVAVAGSLWASGSPTQQGIAFALLGFPVLAAVVAWERNRWGRLGVASPLVLTAAGWYLFFFVAGIGAFSDSPSDPLLGFTSGPLRFGAFAIAVSLSAIALGYWLVTRRHGGRGIEIRRETVAWNALLICLGVGWAARIWRFETRAIGYLGYGENREGLVHRMLQLADGLLLLSFVVLAFEVWLSTDASSPATKRARRLLAINVGLVALTAMASGVKGQLISDLTPVGIVYLLTHHRVPWKPLAALGLYVVLLYGGVTDFRTDIAADNLTAQSRTGLLASTTQVVQRIGASWATKPPYEHVREAWEGVRDEYAGISRTLAIILRQTPRDVPELGVTRLVAYPVFFIPSSWMGDLVLYPGGYVSVTYLGSTSTSASPPTQPGDFYMSGGWSALVAGEFAVGLLLGAVWRFTVKDGRQRRFVFYAFLSTLFVNAGLDWGTLARAVLQNGLVYLVVLTFLYRAPAVHSAAEVSPA